MKSRGVNEQLSKLRQKKLGLVVFAAILTIKKCSFGHEFRRQKYFTGKIEAI